MLQTDIDVIVVGGGAAGMMAALFAAEGGERVALLEKNSKTGKKLYITGKGRCNFTNTCDTEDIFSQIVRNAKFLYSSIYGFTNYDVIDFFERNGLKVKEERGGRMFPASDKSSDIIKTLDRALDKLNVDVRLDTEVKDLAIENNTIKGVILSSGDRLSSKRVILATGGVSYPSTGSTGDGHRWADKYGHRVTKLVPSLTGLTTKEAYVRDIQGLTLINTKQVIYDSKSNKKLLEGFGEILFTHFGVSGPTMLSASSILSDKLSEGELILSLDIKPALDTVTLDKRLLKELDNSSSKDISNILQRLLPKSLIPVLLSVINVDKNIKGYELSRDDRKKIIDAMKDFKLTLTGVRGFEEAIVTKGGVSVKDIDPHTLESKIISGLYFAGELIDVDALTGGYNLQIAWSTGALAGRQTS